LCLDINHCPGESTTLTTDRDVDWKSHHLTTVLLLSYRLRLHVEASETVNMRRIISAYKDDVERQYKLAIASFSTPKRSGPTSLSRKLPRVHEAR